MTTMPLSLPLEKVRRLALEALSQRLTLLFDSADDWLFEQINQQNADNQQEYMDLMRFLRLQRQPISKHFLKKISQAFNSIHQSTHPAKPETDELSLTGLSLVDNEKMEETVALDSMVQRARNDASLQLQLLAARLTHVCGDNLVDRNNNPLDPRQICEALSEAVADTDWEIKHQLIFYKLFQIHVLHSYSTLIVDCNQLLSAAGVLSDLSETEMLQQHSLRWRQQSQLGQSKLQDRAVNQNSVAATGFEQAAPVPLNPSFAAANELLNDAEVASLNGFAQNQQNRADLFSHSFPAIAQPNAFGLPQTVIGSVAQDAATLPVAELLALINQLQALHGQREQSQAYMQPQQLNQALTNLILQRPKTQGPAKIGDLDSNIINLVALLFESVLEFEHLPTGVKALLGRLQIPYIRIAIADPQFLLSSKHPARLLMNNMAKAGARLNDSKAVTEDPLFQKMQAIVQKILDDDAETPQNFLLLLQDFNEFVAQEERRAVLVSQRVAAREEGRLKADQARLDVSQALQQQVGEQPIPVVMAEIIKRPWCKYLSWIHHREGKDSDEWQQALHLVQQMLNCLLPLQQDEQPAQRRACIEQIDAGVRAGCERIAYTESALNDWLLELQLVFQERMAPPPLDTVKPAAIPVTPAKPEPQQHALDNTPVEEDTVADQPVDTLKPVNPDPVIEGAAVDKVKAKIESLRAPRLPKQPAPDATLQPSNVTHLKIETPTPEPQEAPLPPLSDNDPGMCQAKNLSVGCWLEFKEQDNSIRCKLAAHIMSVDKLIFVNRSGAKLFEKNMLQVAHAFNNGEFTLLDDAQLFDRALENVISGLKKIRE